MRWMLVPMALALTVLGARSSDLVSDQPVEEVSCDTCETSCVSCDVPLMGASLTEFDGNLIAIGRIEKSAVAARLANESSLTFDEDVCCNEPTEPVEVLPAP